MPEAAATRPYRAARAGWGCPGVPDTAAIIGGSLLSSSPGSMRMVGGSSGRFRSRPEGSEELVRVVGPKDVGPRPAASDDDLHARPGVGDNCGCSSPCQTDAVARIFEAKRRARRLTLDDIGESHGPAPAGSETKVEGRAGDDDPLSSYDGRRRREEPYRTCDNEPGEVPDRHRVTRGEGDAEDDGSKDDPEPADDPNPPRIGEGLLEDPVFHQSASPLTGIPRRSGYARETRRLRWGTAYEAAAKAGTRPTCRGRTRVHGASKPRRREAPSRVTPRTPRSG